MILFAIVLLTVVSLSLRVTILGLEATVFVMNRADNIRKVGETAVVQSTRLKGKNVYRTARTLQRGVDFSIGSARLAVNTIKTTSILAIKSILSIIRFVVARLRDLLLALEAVVLILDIVIFLVLSSAAAGYMVLYCTTNEDGQIVYNEEVLESLGGTGGSSNQEGESSQSQTSDKSNEFLLDCDNVDPNYKGQTWQVEDRELLERCVTNEFGSDYNGSVLVAQTIRDTMIKENTHKFEDVFTNYGYDTNLPSEPLPNAVNAVKYVFDEGGSGVQHKMMCFYASNITHSAWHEAQEFVVQYQNVRFFDFD